MGEGTHIITTHSVLGAPHDCRGEGCAPPKSECNYVGLDKRRLLSIIVRRRFPDTNNRALRISGYLIPLPRRSENQRGQCQTQAIAHSLFAGRRSFCLLFQRPRPRLLGHQLSISRASTRVSAPPRVDLYCRTIEPPISTGSLGSCHLVGERCDFVTYRYLRHLSRPRS